MPYHRYQTQPSSVAENCQPVSPQKKFKTQNSHCTYTIVKMEYDAEVPVQYYVSAVWFSDNNNNSNGSHSIRAIDH